jgi:hypothetical protein
MAALDKSDRRASCARWTSAVTSTCRPWSSEQLSSLVSSVAGVVSLLMRTPFTSVSCRRLMHCRRNWHRARHSRQMGMLSAERLELYLLPRPV